MNVTFPSTGISNITHSNIHASYGAFNGNTSIMNLNLTFSSTKISYTTHSMFGDVTTFNDIYGDITDRLNDAIRKSHDVITRPSTSPPEDVILVPLLWGLFIVIGLLGNGLVVYVMLRHGERNATNCFIVNLALTDLAFIVIVIPFTMIYYVMPSWIFGQVMCKFHMYIIYVSMPRFTPISYTY